MDHKKPHRNTRQRQVIPEQLLGADSHPTAAKLYEFTRRLLPKLSLATVYRNLELLAADGAIQKLESSGTESRFDWNPQRHCHVGCGRCGQVDDLHGTPRDPVGNQVKALGGYEILGYRLEFIGLRDTCKATRAPEGKGAALFLIDQELGQRPAPAAPPAQA